MEKAPVENAGYLVSGEGIHYLLNNSCDCCPDHNRFLQINPLKPENVSSVSLDICVGRYLWEFKDKDVPYFDSNQHSIKEFLDKYTHRYDLVKDLDGKLIIHKDQFMLLEVLEEIHFNRHVSGHVLGKSSIGRLGLIIQTASIINPMQMQKLVLEIKNISPITLIFHHGTPIAQIQFYFFPQPVQRHYQKYGTFK
ncbi:MAG: 2'-deoxycytidine 5'-triphosphate deaminase [Candidatus Helarchaeota archaeon]|nr:2'-deoxycytidine 5'-triphosphate deaminase [Candidatus Helarchaeota archaeon]